MAKLISQRGSSFCRACDSNNLVSVLDLGSQPLPSEYGLTPDTVLDVFPLHLMICPKCGLGQIGEYVLPERIFHKKYPYLSSASATWVEHAKKYALSMKDTLNLDAESLVVELASNDGYLLQQFQALDIPVLGVEPSANVAQIAQEKGVETVVDFFGAKLAKEIVLKYGNPKVVVANNVCAHIPDMDDFINGISILADENSVITIENPSFATLLKETLFDTIYHEHYSYLSAHAMQEVVKKHDLKIVHIDKLDTHGGSNRYWLKRDGEADSTVLQVLQEEKELGLFNPDEWIAFANRSKTAVQGLHEWFIEHQELGDVVVGYGAAHKGNTFLNTVGETSKNLVYVVDASKEKQGKFLPGSQVPVLAPEYINSAKPTDVLILPWNIAPELAKFIKERAPNARIWVAQPKMRRIS